MGITLELPDPLFARLKARAALQQQRIRFSKAGLFELLEP
ncbi:hypothetical protein SynA15127_02234 [Synechococcus sp. A15-127]|nr:hypothetical protein SynA15127_02234 [Synechococcus sp. A15-127]